MFYLNRCAKENEVIFEAEMKNVKTIIQWEQF